MERYRCKKLFRKSLDILGVLEMKAINFKSVLWIIVAMVVIIFAVNLLVSGGTISFNTIKDSVSLSVTIISIASLIFCSYLWKMPIFRKWLVLIPDLNGTWTGTIESDWIDPTTNEKAAPINTELIIKQSLFKISCVMKTGDMRSDSISSNLNIDADNQKYQLVYIYMSVPKQNKQADSPIHYGTMMFDFDDNFKVQTMSGNYWTGRKTGGHISVEKK